MLKLNQSSTVEAVDQKALYLIGFVMVILVVLEGTDKQPRTSWDKELLIEMSSKDVVINQRKD